MGVVRLAWFVRDCAIKRRRAVPATHCVEYVVQESRWLPTPGIAIHGKPQIVPAEVDVIVHF